MTGCVEIGGGDIQPTLYYTLEPVPAVTASGTAEVETFVVGLGKIEMPDYLDRKEIVVRKRRNELRYTANNLWAERPGDSLPRVLALNISRQSNSPVEVHALPWNDYANPGVVILVEVHALEGQESPSARVNLEVSWSIQSLPDGVVLKKGSYQSSGLSWNTGDYADLAKSLSDELAALGRLIGSDLAEIHETFFK
ncbi:MAG: PqiC family protein [Verrucomicrobia bacterium]|nr:PqiC family protein [Verrucomicrobiota bacterium]